MSAKITKTIQNIRYATGDSFLEVTFETKEPRVGTIQEIFVELKHRSTGIGTALLKAIIKDADISGWTLELDVQAEDDLGLNDEELLKWYRSYGFRIAKRKDEYLSSIPMMKRTPKK